MTKKLFYCGATNCCGCPETIAIRNILDVAGKNTVIVNATSCSEIISSQYPTTSWGVNYVHSAFENAAATASGVELALEMLGKEGNVIALAGDGGTFDIGLQALSGVLERGHKVCFICLDNNAYANTGIQRSSATPYGAWTTTSPPGRFSVGNETWKKPIMEIVAAHQIPYAATASVGFLNDLKEKMRKALEKKNQPSFVHIECPCPIGWKFDSSKTIEIAKLSVETGMWILYEVVNGKFRLTHSVEKRRPVSEYLKTQGRFKHLSEKETKKIQGYVDREWKRLIILCRK